MKKKQRFYESILVDTYKTWISSLKPVYEVPSSDGESYYEVRVYEEGFTCDCMGFHRWGTQCKHIRQIEEKIYDAIEY